MIYSGILKRKLHNSIIIYLIVHQTCHLEIEQSISLILEVYIFTEAIAYFHIGS